VNREQGQLVFVDTPGIHISEKKINCRLKAAARRTIGESDLILYLLDASRSPGDEESAVVEILNTLPQDMLTEKTIAVINKTDLGKADSAAIKNFLSEKIPLISDKNIFTVSALKKEGLEEVLRCLYTLAPEGHPYYDEECYTDQDVRFRISEIIREKAMNFLREEIPHCIYVDIRDIYLEKNNGGNEVLNAFVLILTERDSQKGIIIGKGGAMLKKIRIAALHDLETIFDWKIKLDIRVKTERDWRHNDKILKKFV
jgi:GTP-binding protein Era